MPKSETSSACSSDSQKNTEVEELLFEAAKKGDVNAIQDLIASEKITNINVKEVYSNNTALHIAAQNNQTGAIEKLLDLGADPKALDMEDGETDETLGETAFQIAVAAGSLDAIKTLIGRLGMGLVTELSNDGENPIYSAAFNKEPEVLKFFLEQTPTGKTMINAADKDGTTPLIAACMVDNVECVKVLLDNGADVTLTDKDGEHCLTAAYDSYDCLKALLDSGKVAELLSKPDGDGKTALQKAEAEYKDYCEDEDYSDKDREDAKKIVDLLKTVCI